MAETDHNGLVVLRTRYGAYGAPTDGNYRNGPGYTGHVTDAATGLTYMQQRYYDPLAARFLSLDPVAADPNTGANFNRYWYGNNNPYKFVDPDGRQACILGRGCAQNPFDPFEIDPFRRFSFGGQVENSTQQKVTDKLSKGWERFKENVECIWTCGLPGNGSLEAQLAALPPVIGIPIRAASGINITSGGLAHVLQRHFPGGLRTAGKSVFGVGEDAAVLVRNANGVQRAQQAGGNFERVVDAGRTIGIDRATGQPTSIYTVITNAADDLITAFPGRP